MENKNKQKEISRRGFLKTAAIKPDTYTNSYIPQSKATIDFLCPQKWKFS